MGKKIALIAVFIAFVVSVIYYLEDEDNQFKLKLSLEGSLFKDTYFVQKKDGEVKLALKSSETFISDDGKFMELKGVLIDFPEKNFKVSAQKAHYYPELGDLYLKEGIEGSSDQIKITGTEAYWKGSEKTLYSENPLIITGKNFSITGNSGKAKADLIELNKGVKAIVYSKN